MQSQTILPYSLNMLISDLELAIWPYTVDAITIGALATISILRENITQFSPDHTKQEVDHEYANRWLFFEI